MSSGRPQYQKMSEEQQPKSQIHPAHAEEDQNDRIPPDFAQAQLHRKAWAVGQFVLTEKQRRDLTQQKKQNQVVNSVASEQNLDAQEQICKCCSRTVPNQLIKISCNSDEYGFLGTGLPLYFEFIKGCISILLVIFVTSGDYNVITNYIYGLDCRQLEDPKQVDDPEFCVQTWVTSLSLANKRTNAQFIEIQQTLNFVTVMSLMVMLQYLRKQQREMENLCDEQTIYCSDYTVHVKNIPSPDVSNQKFDIDEDLKQVFRQYLNDQRPLGQMDQRIRDFEEKRKYQHQEKGLQYKPLERVLNANLVYKLDRQTELQALKSAKIAEKQKALSALYAEGVDPYSQELQKNQYKMIPHPKLQQIQIDIDGYEQEMEELEKVFEQGQGNKAAEYFLNQAFLTFQWEDDAEFVLQRNQTSWLKNLKGFKGEIVYKGNILQISQPPEPTDVFWTNLHVGAGQKLFRRIIGFLINLSVLALCAGAIYYLSSVQQDAASQQAEAIKRGEKEVHIGVKLLAYAASILITVINTVLAMIIDSIAKFQSYSTQTGYNISVASNSGIAQFINTALITFLISTYITKNIFGSGGLIYNQTYVFITNMIVPAVISLIDFGTISKWVFIKLEERKQSKSVLTQVQLNTLYERPIFNISLQYAVLLKNMYVTAFYAAIIPVGLIIQSLGLVLHYWVEKVNIAKRRSIKFNYGTDLSIQMIEQLELVLPIYCLTNVWWEYVFSSGSDISTFAYASSILSILNAILPMHEINEILFPITQKSQGIDPYQVAEETLLTDYDRENPGTAENARARYIERIAKHKKQRKQLENEAIVQAANNIANAFK